MPQCQINLFVKESWELTRASVATVQHDGRIYFAFHFENFKSPNTDILSAISKSAIITAAIISGESSIYTSVRKIPIITYVTFGPYQIFHRYMQSTCTCLWTLTRISFNLNAAYSCIIMRLALLSIVLAIVLVMQPTHRPMGLLPDKQNCGLPGTFSPPPTSKETAS